MTEKRCTDCKHTKGIGYDFWCGEGHTEYEVFIGETNCPYFEYYDWSKGTPSRTEKRFTCHQMIEGYSTGEDIDFDFLQELIDEQEQPKDLRMHISDGNKIITYRECVDLLNEFDSENKRLEKENLNLSEELDYYKAKCASLETGLFQADRENEQLRKENKKLKSINNQLEDRLEESGIGIALKMEDLND